MLAKLEGPKVRSVRPAEDWLKDALVKAHEAEHALDAALLAASGDTRSLRMARALASSLAEELSGILADSGVESEIRLRASAIAKATA